MNDPQSPRGDLDLGYACVTAMLCVQRVRWSDVVVCCRSWLKQFVSHPNRASEVHF